jgi:hypothetical protein
LKGFSQKPSLQCSGGKWGGMKGGWLGLFPVWGIMTVVACFQAGGKWWARMQLLKITVRATMAIRGRFLNMGALKFVGPRGLFALQLPDVRFHLVRKNLDDERVVFRKEAEGMVGGVATEVVDASYHLREKASSKWGSLGLGGFVQGFRRSNLPFQGGVYDCVVPNEVVDSGGFLSCQSLELSPELLPVPVVEESTRVDPLLLTETVQVSSDLRIESVEDGF